jgi:CMP-N-acetylneuraminic acid synthetase
MNPYIVGAIFARGGSKRVPGKNVRHLGGRPLIGHAIDVGLSSRQISRVVVSTDDEGIAEVAQECGADVPFMRPPELADDQSSEWLAWKHAIETLSKDRDHPPIDVFVCIPTTAPLRVVEDVDTCIDVFLQDDVDVVITVKKAEHNPYYNMVRIGADHLAHQVIESENSVYRREAYPTVYDMTTVAYVARPDFVVDSTNPFEGRVKAVEIPAERALDIDTELDFLFAEFVLEQRTSNSAGGAYPLGSSPGT